MLNWYTEFLIAIQRKQIARKLQNLNLKSNEMKLPKNLLKSFKSFVCIRK